MLRARRLPPILLTSLLPAITHAAVVAPPAPAQPAAAAPAAVVVDWSEQAYDVGYGEDQFMTFKAQHAMALMHLAMHDAVDATAPRYERYAFRGVDARADPQVAAAQAARDVLVARYPGAAPQLDGRLAQWVARTKEGDAARRGVDLGRQAAVAVLAAAGGGGWDTPGSYRFRDAPGAYRATNPESSFVLQPGFRSARPFFLTSAHQLRPAPPPPLASPAYAAAFAEVKRLGGVESEERSADASAYAVWWMEFAEGSVTRLARTLVAERGLGLGESARLFALLAGSLFDAYVATWDSKYEFDTWRPSTAVRSAGEDGNPATAPEPGWRALRPEPPFPEYVSAHAAGCGAVFAVLAHVLDLQDGFEMRTITAPPDMPSRRFASFAAAAEECADSRVQLGWHFRFATDAGLTLGRGVAGWAITHHLRPTATPPSGGKPTS